MRQTLICLVCFLCHSLSTTHAINNEFVILLISQPHIYILSQSQNASASSIPAHLPLLYAHSYSSSIENWYAIYPLFATILDQYPRVKWLFICEPQTRFRLPELVAFATRQTSHGYLGHALYDTEPSIIHHYSLAFDSPYPDLSAGLLISRSVLVTLIDRLRTHEKPIDFVIDVKYELNQLINELTETTLIDRSDLFCYEDREGCLTWLDGREEYSCQRADIHLTDVYFGIKTFVGYHQQRLGLLRKTWLNETLHYNLFTNEVNTTADRQNDRFVITGENTARGHCHKTMFILNYFYRTKSTLNYLIVADDDTLLSVQGVLRLLRCFMLAEDVPLVLGERYGYQDAYDYPTGGSGILLNRQAVEQIVHNCQCPSADTPDDMFLGICLKRLRIPLIHIPELHQAQPNAYPKDWLAHQKPISFHKFEGIDVEHIYRTHLDNGDDRRDRHVNEEL